MASSATSTAADTYDRRGFDRLSDDWGELKKRVKSVVREYRGDYRRLTGTTPARKPDPRKYPKARSGGGR